MSFELRFAYDDVGFCRAVYSISVNDDKHFYCFVEESEEAAPILYSCTPDWHEPVEQIMLKPSVKLVPETDTYLGQEIRAAFEQGLYINGELIDKNSDQIGGDDAISYLPDAYDGITEVITRNGKLVAVLPSPGEARKVASYAIKPDGGYGSVAIYPSSKDITHQTFDDWAF